jgi:hypothetical protein
MRHALMAPIMAAVLLSSGARYLAVRRKIAGKDTCAPNHSRASQQQA